MLRNPHMNGIYAILPSYCSSLNDISFSQHGRITRKSTSRVQVQSPTPMSLDKGTPDTASPNKLTSSPPKTPRTPKRRRVVNTSEEEEPDKPSPATPTPKRKFTR
jgi:hypothetical protein